MGNSTQEAATLSEWFRATLKRLGWTQLELASRAGISDSSLSEILRGDQKLTANTASKLAAVTDLEVTATRLLRLAGQLAQPSIDQAQLEEATELYGSLSPDDRQLTLDYMHMLRQRREQHDRAHDRHEEDSPTRTKRSRSKRT